MSQIKVYIKRSKLVLSQSCIFFVSSPFLSPVFLDLLHVSDDSSHKTESLDVGSD